MPFSEFYSNIKSLRGNYAEVLNLRNEYLNKSRTDYNKDQQKAGKSLCTNGQIEAFIERRKRKMNEIHEIELENKNNEYLEFLKNKEKR